MNGLLVFDIAGRVSMRLGVANDKEFQHFAPPARAYLYGGFKSNVDDFVQRSDSTDDGFALFIYKVGNATTDMLMRFLDKGTIDIMYAPPNATVDARFTFDLASQQEQYAEYMDCMTTLLEKVR